jgi:hypothetical protein
MVRVTVTVICLLIFAKLYPRGGKKKEPTGSLSRLAFS